MRAIFAFVFAGVVLASAQTQAGFVVYTFTGHIDQGLIPGDPLGIDGQDFNLKFWADSNTTAGAVDSSTIGLFGFDLAGFQASGQLEIDGVYSSVFDATLLVGEAFLDFFVFQINTSDLIGGVSTGNFTFPNGEENAWTVVLSELDPDTFDDADDLPTDIQPGDMQGIQFGEFTTDAGTNPFSRHYYLHITGVSSATTGTNPAAATPAPEPGTLALMGLGGLGLASGAFRRRSRAKTTA